MKRIAIFIIIGILVVLGLAAITVGPNNIGKVPQAPPAVKAEKPEVSLTLQFSPADVETVRTTAKTAFEALKNVTDVKGVPLKTKQYDFGIFVESIRDMPNTKDKVWIYYVNGKSGEVAADTYTLSDNDKVEWRYTAPKNE